MPVRTFGLPNAGGPVITGGDLVFIGAAADGYLRAFDVETGRELWRHRLPSRRSSDSYDLSGGAGIAAIRGDRSGGQCGALGTTRSDWLVAFALPGTAAAAPLKRPAESASIPP